jgi:hypothetical protein
MAHDTLKLVEECTGVGELMRCGAPVRRVSYRISRFQGMHAGSGMPIPGLHKIEGAVDVTGIDDVASLVGASLSLRLEDGRSVALTLTDVDGHVLTEGHGPGRGCMCC